ncbi:GTP 3',8-cyclase MoaA [Propionibacterium sp. oral taxon 192]|uniref:GTP 3',8-cyclase MoaA n=1 Tax=Propionibacterium sp. oral taxon 192 TaxID=671222 RepID=UPI00056022DE|nr:GTP 3',8-cyclase MoaA [Propionibacterium sp. oral taxon 192]
MSATDRSGRTDTLLLRDKFDRVARDLRVSLTDRCNLRCSYCMPPEGLEWLPDECTLTDDEVVRLCRIGVEILGIRAIRFTGGEPLLRPGLEAIVQEVSQLRTDEGMVPDISMTTNGLGLAHRAHRLAGAGMVRVNISLDTIDADHFRQITRRDRLPDVLAGIAAAGDAGLSPIKVNAVLLKGINDEGAGALLEFCLNRGIELRFIEQMPIGPRQAWDRSRLVTRDDILALLGRDHRLTPVERCERSAPARLWLVDDDPENRVGIIASVSEPFCADCDRTRLTSDGQIRSCLFATREFDLRGILRGGGSDVEVARAWADAMWLKPSAHGLDEVNFATPSRTMSRIGG